MKSWSSFAFPRLVFMLFAAMFLSVVPTSTPYAGRAQEQWTSLSTQAQFLEISIPIPCGLNPAYRPPIATYEWRTLAGVPDPVEVRWIIVDTQNFNSSYAETEEYIRTNPDAPEWMPWVAYGPPNIGTSWTSPPVDFGRYVFAVQGKDGNGVVCDEFTLDRNMRRILVGVRTTGPLLIVTGDYIDDIMTSVTVTPPTEVELYGGTPVNFCWMADASVYCGVTVGYRYGWDLTDPDDDSQWAIPFTPFVNEEECSPSQIFYSGVHTFYIEVIDNDGFKSRVPIQIDYSPDVPVELTTWGKIKELYGGGTE